MSICMHCQKENEEGAKFCKDCGNDLSVNADAPSQEELRDLADKLNQEAKSDKKEPVNINKIVTEFPKKLLSWITFPFKKMGKKRSIIVSSVVVVVAVIAVLCAKFVFPYAPHYFKANSALKSENFVTAIEEYKLSNRFLNSKTKLNETYYMYAESLFADGEYYQAYQQYILVTGKDEVDGRLKECGTFVLEAKKYDQASEILDNVKDESAVPLKNYADAMVYFNQKEYYFAKGKFQTTDNYNDSKKMVNACELMIAEVLCENGEFNRAKDRYAALPQDFSYNGISVSARLALLNNSSELINAMGTWKPTDNYIESKNVYKRTGSWDSWYYSSENVLSGSLKLSCELNDNNTFTIKGEVDFYKFDDYSSLKAYCYAKSTSRTFQISNVTVIPGSYNIDSHTTLTYSGGVFKLNYYLKDNYSTYFYNVYTSDITYGR